MFLKFCGIHNFITKFKNKIDVITIVTKKGEKNHDKKCEFSTLTTTTNKLMPSSTSNEQYKTYNTALLNNRHRVWYIPLVIYCMIRNLSIYSRVSISGGSVLIAVVQIK